MVGTVVVKRGSCVLTLLALGGLVSACGAGSSGFESPSVDRGTTLGNLLAFNSPSAPAMSKPVDTTEKPTCPEIEVLDGTASSRVYAGVEQSNGNVRYQFSMGDVVRECSRVGDQLVIKVGVEGRALLGPMGSPGGFTAPVRVAVRRERDETAVASKLYQVPVSIGAGDANAPFSIVTDPIGVPFLSAQANTDYTIVVGFDPRGDGGVGGKPRKAKRRKT